MNYDIAAGLDNTTLNAILSQVYHKVYPSIFKDTLTVGTMGIASVGFDINVSPTANLNPSMEARNYFRDALKNNTYGSTSGLGSDDTSTMIDLAAAASFGLVAPGVALTINYTSGTPPTIVNASLNAVVNIQAITSSGNNLLTFQILSAVISLSPPNPTLEALLNSAVVPAFLIPYLNQNLLSPIQIPALKYGSLQVSLPVPVVNSPFVTAYSALGTTQPDIPPASQWPTNCVYIATDASALQAAAAIPFPLGPSTGFSWEIISGTVGAQVLAPNPIVVNSDGSLSATIVAHALAQLTLHTPNGLPNVNFGPDAQASLSATLKASVINGQLCLVIEGCPIPTFSFDWGIPSWINWLFYPLEAGLAAALNAILGPLIGNILHLPPIPVYTIPTISFTLAGKTINITISQATTSSQNSFLVISAQATVS